MELLIENRNDDKIYNFSEIVGKVSYSSSMKNGAGTLKFTYHGKEIIGMGSPVRFRYNDENIFFGYVFAASTGEDGRVTVTAYDQLRYFKYKDLFPQENMTLSQVVKDICEKHKFYYGEIEETGHILKDKAYSNKTLLDICYSGIQETLISTGNRYILMDNYGKIELKEGYNMRLELYLGDMLGTYGYSYSKGIDGKSYNRIKLLLKKDKTLKEFYIAEDKKTQGKWGTLQYCEAMENKTMTQIKNIAADLLRLYNREEEKLSLKCIGDVKVRGGSGVVVILEDIEQKSWFTVNKVQHTFTKDLHTMDLELII